MSKICDCRKRVEEKLKEEFNQKIVLHGYDLITGRSATVFNYNEGRNKITSYMFHSYCPFCGVKYEKDLE